MSENVYTPQQLHQFEQGWTDMMVDIWHERMTQLRVYDTGALMSSVSGSVQDGATKIIEHKFLEYGIYVAAGVGNRYEHDNGGDLEFLDKEYRKAHGLDKPRKRGPAWGGGYTSGRPRERRDWFSKKYLYSIHRLNEKEAAFYGEAYLGMLPTVLDAMFNPQGKMRSL